MEERTKLTKQDFAQAKAEAPKSQAEQDLVDDLRHEEETKVEEIPIIEEE